MPFHSEIDMKVVERFRLSFDKNSRTIGLVVSSRYLFNKHGSR